MIKDVQGVLTEGMDEMYWAEYYKSGAAPEEPSNFAKYVMGRHVNPGDSMLELGCGNGRDARFFSTNGVAVIAVDQCASEIDELVKTNGKHENLLYRAADFTDMSDSDKTLDVVYSRFTLHSVTAEGQARALEWSQRNLRQLGKICIETRGQKNELYKKGEPVPGQDDAYIYEGHYRRFVDFAKFQSDIKQAGFSILEASEETGFAPLGDTDYHFIRVIAQK